MFALGVVAEVDRIVLKGLGLCIFKIKVYLFLSGNIISLSALLLPEAILSCT